MRRAAACRRKALACTDPAAPSSVIVRGRSLLPAIRRAASNNSICLGPHCALTGRLRVAHLGVRKAIVPVLHMTGQPLLKPRISGYAHQQVVPVVRARELKLHHAAVTGTNAFRMFRMCIEIADADLDVAAATIVNREPSPHRRTWSRRSRRRDSRRRPLPSSL